MNVTLFEQMLYGLDAVISKCTGAVMKTYNFHIDCL